MAEGVLDASGAQAPLGEAEPVFVQMTRHPQPSLAWGVGVSSAWGVVHDRLGDPDQTPGAFVNLGRLARRGAPPAVIDLAGARLMREVNVADVADLMLARGGYQEIERIEVRSLSGLSADSLASRTLDGRRWALRSLVRKDGDMAFLLRMRCAWEDLERLAGEFARAAQSFVLLDPSLGDFAEPLVEFTLLAPTPMRFDAPLSWERHDRPLGPEGGDGLLLINRLAQRACGQIVVVGFPEEAVSGAEALSQALLARAFGAGFTGAIPALESVDNIGGLALKTWRMRVDGDLQGKPVRLDATLMALPAGWVSVLVWGPSPQGHPEIEAVNRRAYEIVLQSLRVGR
ncbi:MAG: hypothetical protein ACFB2Z_13630 [Maricaulaceae bacterium]